MSLPSLVSFGALAPLPAPEKLHQLRYSLLQQKSLKPIVQAINELPQLWKSLLNEDPSLNSIAGEAAANQLSQWVEGSAQIANDKGNMIRMPVTIIGQIARYVTYLCQSDEPIAHESIIRSVAAGGGIQGLCIGLLSALALASSKTDQDIGHFAAVSVLLAFCVGAYIDLDEHRGHDGAKTSTLAVRWRTPIMLDDIQRIVGRHQNAYIAVVRDARDVTIVTPVVAAPLILQEINDVGGSVRDIGISGRFHSDIHCGVSRKILKACKNHCSLVLSGHGLVRSNTESHILPDKDNDSMALNCILGERADWFSTISAAASSLNHIATKPFILAIGTDAVPQSISRNFPVVKATRIINSQFHGATQPLSPTPAVGNETSTAYGYPENSVAVVGMACKLPGANTVDELWSMLTSGKSMLSEAPERRFGRGHASRPKRKERFLGNFLSDIEDFDHKFFKKSPREAESMDPQQRILLQVAYECLESSGYFAGARPDDVGCYIGACATDYDFNVASHPPTAFSAIGTLRSFLSGKLSHYFGWSGPSLVLDTACSSSAVAIHTACTALQTGQCSMALAGGITLMTSSYLYENFTAAHFLSPTGGSKPFSADADGYGRGEGCGLVVLRLLSNALRDNDHVLGVIAGSAVNQNKNSVPITVPDSSSQGSLYEQVTRQAGIMPAEVTFVEAHGTGTPVGDPIEIESIRRVFGGPIRDTPLVVSSVKGNIGHLEGASGVAALIKAILQMEHRLAPQQASYRSLNPKIPDLEPSNIFIPVSNVTLSGARLAACVNNYGAAGSNAAMIILESPTTSTHGPSSHITFSQRALKYPIQLTAASERSLRAYCTALDVFCYQLQSTQNHAGQPNMLSDVAFSLARRQNQDLPFSLTLTATDLNHLQAQLRQQTASTSAIKQRPKPPPLVLCFGGQVSNRVGLDKTLWEESVLLRSNLDMCDNLLRSMDYPGIYPGIFQDEPVTDVVALHGMIFSLQYSCAQAWLKSGLMIDALIGHSFGQITAMAVSESLSLRDGLRLVAGRAALMQKYWGSDPGAMIAVEADLESLDTLQSAGSNINHQFEVACLNGPTSHVLVCETSSAKEVERQLAERAIRYKRLDVPYGFHSRFTEPLLQHLEELASGLTFHTPKIRLETATDKTSWTIPTPSLIAAHTRQPVFFGQAIQRLQDQLGPCTWLEAGSDSSIVAMVRRAQGPSQPAGNNFIPMQLNKPSSADSIADTAVALWNIGHQTSFWNFHRVQRSQYKCLRLPPYVWEKTKHWLELDMSPSLDASKDGAVSSVTKSAQPELPPVLIRLLSTDSRGHNFTVNPCSEEYCALTTGLESLGGPPHPSTFYVELASRAARIAYEGEGEVVLSVRNLNVRAMAGADSSIPMNLNLQHAARGWRFTIFSAHEAKNKETICLADGIVDLRPVDGSLDEDFNRYERLTGHETLASIVDNPRSESLRGSVIYKMLTQTINYPDWYRGVKAVAAIDSRVMAKVTRPAGIPDIIASETATQLPVLESFIQVVSLHANCLRECHEGRIYQLSKIDYLQLAPGFKNHAHDNAAWDVTAYAGEKGPNAIYDIFVRDTMSAELVLFMLGVQFSYLDQVITTSTVASPTAEQAPTTKSIAAEVAKDNTVSQSDPEIPKAEPHRVAKDVREGIFEDICGLLEKLADISRDEVRGDASFDDLGMDSLMMIEIISELSSLFCVELPIDEMEVLTDINSLVDCLHGKGCARGSTVDDVDFSSTASTGQGKFTEPGSLAGSSDASPTPPTSSLEICPDSFFAKSIPASVSTVTEKVLTPLDMGPHGVQNVFARLRLEFQKYADQTGATGFWANVYPQQEALVCAYVVDAYRELGCDIGCLAIGEQLPSISALDRHKHLVAQLRNILVDSGLFELKNQVHIRTAKPLATSPTVALYERMLHQYPSLISDTKVLNATAPYLGACLLGKKEPLSLLFGDKHNRDLLANFYSNSQMCNAASRLLAEFVRSIPSAAQSGDTLYILEVGAGTGGTTKHLVEALTRCKVSFEYTFTDISQSLVTQAKRNFSTVTEMRFATFDCSKPPPSTLLGKFHLVVSTNCIHATSNLTTSAACILPTLRDDGALCVVEFTRNISWFDLVFGLLEGWWLFSDGRKHALASEQFWKSSFLAAGFKHVSWSDGETEEAQTIRLICAFKEKAADHKLSEPNSVITKRAGILIEEVIWKHVDGLDLSADIYFPKVPDPPGKKRPIALLIHGGGHFLFGRKDVPMKHIRILIERGFLPVSTDYRLCPEKNLFDGPMTDCCDALKWVTETLATLSLSGPAVWPDPDKVVVFGWSSGGQLAMSLGYTANNRGIKGPDAIFALYPPSDMESDHWHRPCYPGAAEEEPAEVIDILAGVRKEPIIEYAPVSEKKTMALSLTLKDDRAKIILHMCWNSQTVPILVHGLPHKESALATDNTDWRYPPPASSSQVRAISPLWQIRHGNYRTPTFIVHGNADDWLPLSMSEQTIGELKRRGIPASLAVPDQCGHAFDLFPVGDPLNTGWVALEKGYDFICEQLSMA